MEQLRRSRIADQTNCVAQQGRETKNETSASSVTVIEPLRGVLEKLRAQAAGESILSNGRGKPLSLDSLNVRVIAPALKAAGSIGKATTPDGAASVP
jgi:hypothetical protein